MESPDATTAQEDYLASMNHNDFLSAGSSFVKKLHIMVSTEMDDIIEWGADGTFFEIKDSRRLEIEVLPRYFR